MPIGAGRVVARSYMAFAFGLLGLNCLRGGIAGGGSTVEILTGHPQLTSILYTKGKRVVVSRRGSSRRLTKFV